MNGRAGALTLALLTACATRGELVETLPGTEVSFELVFVEACQLYVGRTEVTWDEYLLFCDFEERRAFGVDAVSRPSKPLDVNPFDRNWGAGDRPAVGMSRNAAERYCEWLSLVSGRHYRLPSEDEWRAFAGARPDDVRSFAWCADDTNARTEPVAGKRPNEHGLHDVLGNLWEYCGGPFALDEPERAVLRGGSWKESANEIGPAARLGFDDDWTLDDPEVPPGVWWVPGGDHLGFRVVCEP